MKMTLEQIGDGAQFTATPEVGKPVIIHAPLEEGEEKNGIGPMEALLAAAAGCTSVDVVLIMKKMKQKMDHLRIEIEGERVKIGEAKPFRKMTINYFIKGEVDQKKAERAVKLAVEKYCSVLESVHEEIEIATKVVIEE